VLATADAGLDLHELTLDPDRRLAVRDRDHENEAMAPLSDVGGTVGTCLPTSTRDARRS
jgi:hypothetical protein